MDMTVRIGAACVMAAAGAWSGRLLAGAQVRRTQTLAQMLGGVRRLGVEMLERRRALADALEGCAHALFEQTAAGIRAGGAPDEAYRGAAARLRERGGALDSLNEGDMTALGRLFGHLGEGGLQTQRLVIREAEEELERLCEQSRRRQQEYGRLYTSLGALGGIAAALMML